MIPTEINTLFAGPWVGEFGWELFCWQGMLRVNPFLQYDKVISCANGSRLPFLPNCKYIKYGDPTVAPKHYDVLIHARGTDKHGTGFRNWPEFKWADLIKHTGLSYASIGSQEGSYHVDNTDDLRGVSLEELCGYMSASTMVIGPSSGPMHLASLCGTPHFVWSGDKPNVDRYEKYWNPLKTRVKVLDHTHGWDPPLLTILKELEKFYASCCNTV